MSSGHRVHDSPMSPFEFCLDMAARSVSFARRTPDARFRSFLVDLAETWCDLAGECPDRTANGLERLAKTTKMAAELDSFERQGAASLEGVEPRMIPGLEPRTIH
jgi:hypothetical protein